MIQIFGKKIDDLQRSDINRLLENGIPESRQLDYKRKLSIANSSEKKEFLADISAFNNTNGGIIIFGITEKKDQHNNNTGIPDQITPITGLNEDKLKQQIEQLVQDGLSPSLTNLGFKVYRYKR